MDKNTIKNRYIEAFGVMVILLALVRCAFPAVSKKSEEKPTPAVIRKNDVVKETTAAPQKKGALNARKKHRILSVDDYRAAFPDGNDIQMVAAEHWGVPPVKNRKDAEYRKRELVYMGISPYYHVDNLDASIPYLVPRAAMLLEDIGRAYFDSLYAKGVPLHRFIVTSVLRTEVDVRNLRSYNSNATERSCHLYGTTVDVCYNRYRTVEDPEGPPRRLVSNDTLKWVLSEVLRDMRDQGRCYVKYEVKQGCFHMTVR